MTKEFNERERFRHELHDKIGEQEWFGSEEFWVRVRDIEHIAADLHMRYKAESEDKKVDACVLDKIRAEIENHCGLTKENHCRYCSYCNNLMGVREILEAIDKYKAESGKENEE